MATRKKNPVPALIALAKAHGFALVPRASNPAPRRGAKKPKRASQRVHRNKNGTFTKAPTKRLVTRRKKNVRKGYFPNPAAIARAHRAQVKKAKPARHVYVVFLKGFESRPLDSANSLTLAKRAAQRLANRTGKSMVIRVRKLKK